MSDRPDTIADLLKPRPELTQFSHTSSKPAESPPPADDDYVAFGHGRVGLRPRMMLTFRKCSGEVEVLPYSMLMRICSDDTDKGFTLHFGSQTVIVEGQGLTQLFRYLCEHRAVEIVESDRTAALDGEAKSVVTAIRTESNCRK
ncbi:hypothetical protein [Fuerstiella marisgermanici]|uniref:Uncharacterized protein n=1 Tax=Fuerstiella marisgermanici TaxID=1891926 RepID=A0A1P8WKE8_9PLAN|nr:hypothetical protein [Fuerstiella marisgermanici]APZ94534.1 hypothetical protein Fuma_04166 [Fuerstiella marisgermanici]